ncbi:chorismate mutase [Streptomyces sp. NBC_00102]|uniref:chorismate mutase n=1 Tax=Streptomyces sp. NBC_00102 TaxID=2975652 RepID=UPI0022585B3D|nr:chorismate mutase [Streptomyces sp. NBC_00102]MCX5400447.1 chorismate mutase [Streptomyces sp. NBC_00102]
MSATTHPRLSRLTDTLRKIVPAGRVVTTGPECDAGRTLWNGAVSTRPGVIVRCADPAEGTRITHAYGPNTERLLALRHRFDPDNTFRAPCLPEAPSTVRRRPTREPRFPRTSKSTSPRTSNTTPKRIREKEMNLRNKMTRCAAVVGFLGAAAALTAPQAVAAAEARTDAGSVAVPVGAAGRPLGPLGPLTGLVVERLRVGDDVAASKFGTASPVEDPVREAQVLEQVRAAAGTVGVDPDAAAAFFQDQITASKVVQQGLFDRWTDHPEQAPTTRPDLAQIRQKLDRLTTELLQELKDTERLRDNPVGCAAQLAPAGGSGAAREQLDTLHRQALRTATQSVCGTGRPAGQR